MRKLLFLTSFIALISPIFSFASSCGTVVVNPFTGKLDCIGSGSGGVSLSSGPLAGNTVVFTDLTGKLLGNTTDIYYNPVLNTLKINYFTPAGDINDFGFRGNTFIFGDTTTTTSDIMSINNGQTVGDIGQLTFRGKNGGGIIQTMSLVDGRILGPTDGDLRLSTRKNSITSTDIEISSNGIVASDPVIVSSLTSNSYLNVAGIADFANTDGISQVATFRGAYGSAAVNTAPLYLYNSSPNDIQNILRLPFQLDSNSGPQMEYGEIAVYSRDVTNPISGDMNLSVRNGNTGNLEDFIVLRGSVPTVDVPKNFQVTGGSVTMTGSLQVNGSTFGVNGVQYQWPSADGSSNQVLSTNGSKTLSWATVAGSGGGSIPSAGSTNYIQNVYFTGGSQANAAYAVSSGTVITAYFPGTIISTIPAAVGSGSGVAALPVINIIGMNGGDSTDAINVNSGGLGSSWSISAGTGGVTQTGSNTSLATSGGGGTGYLATGNSPNGIAITGANSRPITTGAGGNFTTITGGSGIAISTGNNAISGKGGDDIISLGKSGDAQAFTSTTNATTGAGGSFIWTAGNSGNALTIIGGTAANAGTPGGFTLTSGNAGGMFGGGGTAATGGTFIWNGGTGSSTTVSGATSGDGGGETQTAGTGGISATGKSGSGGSFTWVAGKAGAGSNSGLGGSHIFKTSFSSAAPTTSLTISASSTNVNELLVGTTGAFTVSVNISTNSTYAPKAPLDINQFGTLVQTNAGVQAPAVFGGNVNTAYGFQMNNANNGASANTQFVLADNTKVHYISFQEPSTGGTGSLFGITKSAGDFILTNTLAGGTDRTFAIGTIASSDMVLGTANTERARFKNTGTLVFTAGSAAAGTAPEKYTSGALMTTPEVGAKEFAGDKFYGTITSGPFREEFSMNESTLTPGRVPFESTGGRFNDSSQMTYSTATATLSVSTLNIAGLLNGTTFQFTSSGTVGGSLSINGVGYTWPSADGSPNQVLSTNGSKVLSWVDAGAGSGVSVYPATSTIYANSGIQASTGVFTSSVTYQGNQFMVISATQSIASEDSIQADACGGFKLITSTQAIATSHTFPFVAASPANRGCEMWVVNVGTLTITVKNSANFQSNGVADISLPTKWIFPAFSDGNIWRQLAPVEGN